MNQETQDYIDKKEKELKTTRNIILFLLLTGLTLPGGFIYLSFGLIPLTYFIIGKTKIRKLKNDKAMKKSSGIYEESMDLDFIEKQVDLIEKQFEQELKSAMIKFGHDDKYSALMSKAFLPYISVDIIPKGFNDWNDALIVFYCELINNENYAFNITNRIINGNGKKAEEARKKILLSAFATIIQYRDEGDNPYILSLCEQAYYKVHSSKPESA